jgi:hypothetical protein
MFLVIDFATCYHLRFRSRSLSSALRAAECSRFHGSIARRAWRARSTYAAGSYRAATSQLLVTRAAARIAARRGAPGKHPARHEQTMARRSVVGLALGHLIRRDAACAPAAHWLQLLRSAHTGTGLHPAASSEGGKPGATSLADAAKAVLKAQEEGRLPPPAPTFKKTFYKRTLPTPPATPFSSAEGERALGVPGAACHRHTRSRCMRMHRAGAPAGWCRQRSRRHRLPAAAVLAACRGSGTPEGPGQGRGPTHRTLPRPLPPRRPRAVPGGAGAGHHERLLQAGRAVQHAGRACLLRPLLAHHGAQRAGHRPAAALEGRVALVPRGHAGLLPAAGTRAARGHRARAGGRRGAAQGGGGGGGGGAGDGDGEAPGQGAAQRRCCRAARAAGLWGPELVRALTRRAPAPRRPPAWRAATARACS